MFRIYRLKKTKVSLTLNLCLLFFNLQEVTLVEETLNKTHMKNYTRSLIPATLIMMMFVMQGCGLLRDIFSAGMWIGVFLTLLVIGIIIWIVIKATRGRRNR